MQLPESRIDSHRLTVLAMYAGAFLYFAALVPDLLNYATSTDSLADHAIAALALLSLLLFAMAYWYGSGHTYAINIAIVSMALSVPFTFESQAFLNSSIPQGIWLPFIFALAVSNFRVSLLTLAVSISAAFLSYPGAFRSPRAIVETVVIFLMLMLGRTIVKRLMQDASLANQVSTESNSSQCSESNLSREHQLSFIKYAPISIAMVDRNMTYIACSEKWLKENHRGHDNLIGLNHYLVNPDMPDEWKNLHHTALAGTAVLNNEFFWELSDGTQRWVRSSVQPWKFENGETGGLIISREDITDKKIAESDLNSVLKESGDAIWISDAAGRFIYANPNTSVLTGYHEDELAKLKFSDLIHEEREDELQEYLALTQYAKFTRREWMLNHKNGSTVCVELTTGHLPGGRMIALGRDLTEKMRTESERFKLFQAVEQSPGSIVITNMSAEIEYVNAAFLKKTGYTRLEVMGQNPNMIKSGKTPRQTFENLWETINGGNTWQGEISNISKSGQEFIQFTTISPIRQSNGTITNYIAIGEDITGRKKGEERIFELAYFDQLTGLPNRTLLLDRLNQVIALSSRSGVYGALLFIDLDHFKNINDTLGHQKGDLVLKQVAECLALRLREGDTVARFGGDEFVVLLTGLGTDDDIAAGNAKSAALKLLEALNQTFQLGDVVHHSTASIGVSMFNGKFSNPDELLKQADLAMYKSKKAGRNTMRFFDPSLESAMKQQATLEEDLRIALKDQQFILHYQGQFTIESRLTGAEVLVRWKHPEKGVMSPALFIPFAEESGQILPLGKWVLETACTQLASWENKPGMSHLMLAVNVSALQFRQPDFMDMVLSTISRTGANPRLLKLELTESMLIENVDDIIQKMLALQLHGIGFSLDDFGTGYSSLSFLKRLPLDQLKIDQSFIRDVHSDPNGAAIAKTIVSLGKSLGLNVIAEGVETVEQREFLANAGCFSYQGYLFSRPLALDDFEEMAGAMISPNHTHLLGT
ncbi:diguanylate cyclase (GGDEF)-like protein/PAS domain S-box-containing protein [Oxalobacteraceae bacterium GrIS 2.11]